MSGAWLKGAALAAIVAVASLTAVETATSSGRLPVAAGVAAPDGTAEEGPVGTSSGAQVSGSSVAPSSEADEAAETIAAPRNPPLTGAPQESQLRAPISSSEGGAALASLSLWLSGGALFVALLVSGVLLSVLRGRLQPLEEGRMFGIQKVLSDLNQKIEDAERLLADLRQGQTQLNEFLKQKYPNEFVSPLLSSWPEAANKPAPGPGPAPLSTAAPKSKRSGGAVDLLTEEYTNEAQNKRVHFKRWVDGKAFKGGVYNPDRGAIEELTDLANAPLLLAVVDGRTYAFPGVVMLSDWSVEYRQSGGRKIEDTVRPVFDVQPASGAGLTLITPAELIEGSGGMKVLRRGQVRAEV
jgi:hypothetical protein